MKSREKCFILTAILLFVVGWMFIYRLMDAAQAVGDASIKLNKPYRTTVICAVVVACYGAIYYGICAIDHFFRKLKKKKSDEQE